MGLTALRLVMVIHCKESQDGMDEHITLIPSNLSMAQVNKMLPLLIESHNLMKSGSEDKTSAGLGRSGKLLHHLHPSNELQLKPQRA